MPFVSVTRMALLVFLVSFVLHFSNKSIISKITAGLIGSVLAFFVFMSEGFQEKTFFEGSGDITALSGDLYENENLNNNGRKAWQMALALWPCFEPDLKWTKGR